MIVKGLSNGNVFSAAAGLLRKTIYTRAGDKGEVHNNLALLYHVLFGKPFDIIDFMFRDIEKKLALTKELKSYMPHHVID